MQYFFESSVIVLVGPDIVKPASVGRSPGQFAHTVWLADPDQDKLSEAIKSICHWLRVNLEDPEFEKFQFNIYFSGHGSKGSGLGESSMLMNGSSIKTKDFLSLIMRNFSAYKVNADQCFIQLFLNCCYSASIARDFVVSLRQDQVSMKKSLLIRNIACRNVYCSSLCDEESFDEDGLGNSYFTAGYLRENSAARVRRSYPPLWQIPYRSGAKQHPLMLRIGPDKKVTTRFPALSVLPEKRKADVLSSDWLSGQVEKRAKATGRLRNSEGEAMDLLMCQAECLREVCLPYESSRFARSAVVEYAKRQTRWD